MKRKRLWIWLLLLVGLLIISLLIYRKVSGKSLGIMNTFYTIRNITKSVLDSKNVTAENQGDYTNILFVHHSVGKNLISEGGLREAMQNKGYLFWDQDYSYYGLTKPDGNPSGYSYTIPHDNTDIDGYAAIFKQRVYTMPVNAISAFLQHEVIVFKSCYPNSAIHDDDELELHKHQYLEMRDRFDQFPGHIFILVTTPPLNPAETNLEEAARARALNTWLSSHEFTDGHPNLFVFDFFTLLAEDNPSASDFNMLKSGFRNGTDSHPNQTANKEIAPLLAEFIKESISQYKSHTNQ